MIEKSMKLNAKKNIIKAKRRTRKLFECFSRIWMNSNSPTTCISPETNIVLKWGASAETVDTNKERENILELLTVL